MFKLKLGLSLIGFVCAILFLTASPTQAMETVLQYSLIETRTPHPDQVKNKKKEKEIRLASKKKVVLGDGFFSVTEGKDERIYDFKKRRIHYLDHQAKTHSEISLFADLAFRINEFEHRMRMGDAVQSAGGLPLEDLFTLESIFGLQYLQPKIEFKEDVAEENKIRFLKEDEAIAEISLSGHEISAGAMFENFLIYDASLHPFVRKRIADQKQFAGVIRNQLKSAQSTDQFVLILDDLKTQADQGFQIPQKYSLAKKKPGATALAARLDELLDSIESGKTKVQPYDKQWFWAHMREAEGQKNYLEAVLTVLEYGLQTGDQKATAEEMTRFAVHQKEDAELDRFLRSLGISGKAQAERAIVELKKINRKVLSRTHMLDIMIADQQSVLGKNEEAEKRMLTALRVNPYIAGAYKDLGDMFYTNFDMVAAWSCWDFARKLVPDHFMLKPISDYEQQLLKDFPDFFNYQ